jgi:hypothetical protein
MRQIRRCGPGIALQPRHAIDALGGALEAFVLLQAPHQLRARIRLVRRLVIAYARQQHARFHFGESRRHQQVLARQLQLQHLHQFDVAHVLARDLGDGYVQDIEVLPPYQVQQHVERSFEGLEKHLESLRRDVQVARHLGDRLPLDHGKGHLTLRRLRHGRRRRRRSSRYQRQFRFHL